MATITLNYTCNAATITIPGMPHGEDDGVATFSNTTQNRDPIARAVAQEWGDNATASGTVTITAA